MVTGAHHPLALSSKLLSRYFTLALLPDRRPARGRRQALLCLRTWDVLGRSWR